MTANEPSLRKGIRYQPDETPPVPLAFGLGLQLVVLCVAGIVLTPAIVIRAAGGSEAFLSWAVFAAILVSGVTTLIQAIRFGRFGAGYVLLMGTSGAFIAVCVAAIAQGGPGDARHPGGHLLALPVYLFHVAVAVQAYPDPGRGRHGHHAGGGHGDADHLQSC